MNYQRLIRRHPDLFLHIDQAPPIYPISERGIECGEGWSGLLEALCADLRARTRLGDPVLHFLLIKEDLSRLRIFHSRPASDAQAKLVRRAKTLAARSCRRCGAACPRLPDSHPAAALRALHGGVQLTRKMAPRSDIRAILKACKDSPHPAHHAFALLLPVAWRSFRMLPRLQAIDGHTIELSLSGAPDGPGVSIHANGGIDAAVTRKGRVIDLLLSLDAEKRRTAVKQERGDPPPYLSTQQNLECLLLWINTRQARARWLGILEIDGGSTAAGLFVEQGEAYADLGAGVELVALRSG